MIPRRRGRPAPRGRGRPTSPRARQMQSRSPRGRAMARRRPGSPKNRATRPTINVADLRRRASTLPPKNFVDTMPKVGANSPRAPRGPRSGIQLANQNAMQRQMEAAARANMAQGGRAGKGQAIQRPRPNPAAGKGQAIQRPIPNRDGRMSLMNQMQRDIARAAQMAPNRPRPMTPRPMPQSNYARQPMPAQQLQRGMGRGPMPRANIGQIQAPRPTFGQQMRPKAPRQRLNRRRARIIPRRR
jgi:hypothetical protein